MHLVRRVRLVRLVSLVSLMRLGALRETLEQQVLLSQRGERGTRTAQWSRGALGDGVNRAAAEGCGRALWRSSTRCVGPWSNR